MKGARSCLRTDVGQATLSQALRALVTPTASGDNFTIPIYSVALKLRVISREVGQWEDAPVVANVGRYGLYIKYQDWF